MRNIGILCALLMCAAPVAAQSTGPATAQNSASDAKSAAAAIYSAQFELGPMSEASIGNVGLKAGTMAYVDLVMTPVLGLGMIVAEDAIDRFVIAKAEGRLSRNQTRLLRSLLNPNRSVANLIRFQVPWKRDARDLISKVSLEIQGTPAAARDRAVAPR